MCLDNNEREMPLLSSFKNYLGKGGFGPVYKGFIDDRISPSVAAHQTVAVKLLDLNSRQGHIEWLAEVIFLGQLSHPHLVKLIGYCCEDENRLLVYEYIPQGNLENHLFGRYSVSLPWLTRLKIAVGASALSVILRIFKNLAPRSGKEYCASILLSLCHNCGAEVIGVLEKDPGLMTALYSLLTDADGTSHSNKKARMIINIIHKFHKTITSQLFNHQVQEQSIHVQ